MLLPSLGPRKTTNGGLVRGREHGNATHTVAAIPAGQTLADAVCTALHEVGGSRKGSLGCRWPWRKFLKERISVLLAEREVPQIAGMVVDGGGG
jgi:hypothetical protein